MPSSAAVQPQNPVAGMVARPAHYRLFSPKAANRLPKKAKAQFPLDS
jgi:hypothetical protein